MSRIGQKAIEIPKGVTVEVLESVVLVKGPKGSLRVSIPSGIRFEKSDSRLLARRAHESAPLAGKPEDEEGRALRSPSGVGGREDPEQAALHGMVRSLVANAVRGVSHGFERHLDIVGIGYRAEVKGKSLVLTLGYSHPINFPIPEGISISVEKQTHMVVSGAEKHQVGQVSADLRAMRPPDPYKNKGVRYTGELLKKKVGKAAATAAKA